MIKNALSTCVDHHYVSISQHYVTETHTCCGVEHCHIYFKLWYSISLHANGFILINYTCFINFLLKKFKTKLLPTFLHKSFTASGRQKSWVKGHYLLTSLPLSTFQRGYTPSKTQVPLLHKLPVTASLLDPGHPNGSMLGCYSVYNDWHLLWFYGLIDHLDVHFKEMPVQALVCFAIFFFWLFCFLIRGLCWVAVFSQLSLDWMPTHKAAHSGAMHGNRWDPEKIWGLALWCGF